MRVCNCMDYFKSDEAVPYGRGNGHKGSDAQWLTNVSPFIAEKTNYFLFV